MLLDLLITACLGLWFAVCAGDRLRTDGTWSRPALWLVAIFFGVIRVPLTLYLYWVHPDWSWHYLLDAGEVPDTAVAGVLASQLCVFVGMWLVGAVFMQMEKPRIVLGMLMVALIGTVIAASALSDRLLSYGSYQAYIEHFSLNIMEVKLGYVLIVWGLGTLAATVFVSLELRRDARRARAM